MNNKTNTQNVNTQGTENMDKITLGLNAIKASIVEASVVKPSTVKPSKELIDTAIVRFKSATSHEARDNAIKELLSLYGVKAIQDLHLIPIEVNDVKVSTEDTDRYFETLKDHPRVQNLIPKELGVLVHNLVFLTYVFSEEVFTTIIQSYLNRPIKIKVSDAFGQSKTNSTPLTPYEAQVLRLFVSVSYGLGLIESVEVNRSNVGVILDAIREFPHNYGTFGNSTITPALMQVTQIAPQKLERFVTAMVQVTNVPPYQISESLASAIAKTINQ